MTGESIRLCVLLFSGPALLEYLDKLPPMNRNEDGPVRLPVVDRYKVRICTQ